MGSIYFGFGAIGLLVGMIFSLIYINTSSNWVKIITGILSLGSPTISITSLCKWLKVSDLSVISLAIGIMIFSAIFAFIIIMIITWLMIKQKKLEKHISIVDIFLGQKEYIKNHYKLQLEKIDKELNIDFLLEKEKNIEAKENLLKMEKESLAQERIDLEKVGDKKLRIRLPEKKNFVVTDEFLTLIPSFMENMAMYMNNVKVFTDTFIEKYENITEKDLKAFLLQLSTQMLEDLFGGKANDVRIHFRSYDKDKNGYAKLVCVIQNREYVSDMTFIPYDKNNMIQQSYECKRSLIKSYNLDYDYPANNRTVWKEYITFSFYNIKMNNIPCMSFGISVKNIMKYKQLFCFLNYCQFEDCLREAIEKIDRKFDIKSILY